MCKQQHLSVIYTFALIIFPSLFFKRTRIHEYDDSLYLFSFCFRGDDELLYDWSWQTVINDVYVYDQSKECAGHNLRGNRFERAQNVQDSYVESWKLLSYVFGISDIWAQGSYHDFVFKINTSKSLKWSKHVFGSKCHKSQ